MASKYKLLMVSAAALLLSSATAYAQDEPSLGDLARQQRQQKSQAKPVQGKDAKAPKILTNEEISGSVSSTADTGAKDGKHTTADPTSSDTQKQSADSWKSQIQDEKTQIASLKKEIDELNQSIQFAPGNCVEHCVEWNERQQEKQQQVERMKSQLDGLKKQLEDMQDSARKQGYGSSVYDP